MKKVLYLSITINCFFILLSIGLIAIKGPQWIEHKLLNTFKITKDQSLTMNDDHFKTRYSLFKDIEDNKGDIVFVGDSLTENGNWNELFNNQNVLNRGIAGDTTDGLLKRLDDIIKLNPRKIFLMVGINDFNKDESTQHTMINYRKIISVLHSKLPKTKVYVQSMLPMNNDINGSSVSPSKILDFNKKLKALCVNGVTYINLYPSFADEKHHLKKSLTFDGVHVNGDGYLLWKDKINNYVN